MCIILAIIGAFTCWVFVLRLIAYLFSDRSGNSGRNTHWMGD